MAEESHPDVDSGLDDLSPSMDDLLGEETEVPSDSTDEQTSDAAEQEEGEEDLTSHARGTPPSAAEEQKKYWQSAFTRARQKDRERYGKLEEEHARYGDVLRNFFSDDQYARQVILQRFPQLGPALAQQGTPAATGTPAGGGAASQQLVSLLQSKLGGGLDFLAPVLAEAMQSAAAEAIAPMRRQTQEDQQAARRRQEEAAMAELDTQHPGWEERYGSDMQELHKFLGSGELSHPKFGNRYQLLLKLVNPDQARIDAVQGMRRASQSKVGTGRTGRAAPNVAEQVAKATTNSQAFRLAAEAALAELGNR